MLPRTFTFFALLFATSVFAQTPVDDGTTDLSGLLPPAVEERLLPFVESFNTEDIGFLHIYVDPSVDPLETYLLRGDEMSDAAVALLPDEYRNMSDQGVLYGAIAIRGIDENLYITRFRGESGDQIDMFAIRDGQVEHLKTLAYLRCDTPGNCAQMDAYITDLNLDTTFDLVEISRTGDTDADPKREVFTMLAKDRQWLETDELDVPWDGITFYKHK